MPCVLQSSMSVTETQPLSVKDGYTALRMEEVPWTQNLKAILIAFGQQIILPDSRLSI